MLFRFMYRGIVNYLIMVVWGTRVLRITRKMRSVVPWISAAYTCLHSDIFCVQDFLKAERNFLDAECIFLFRIFKSAKKNLTQIWHLTQIWLRSVSDVSDLSQKLCQMCQMELWSSLGLFKWHCSNCKYHSDAPRCRELKYAPHSDLARHSNSKQGW